MQPPLFRVENASTGRIVCDPAAGADTFLTRFLGLLLRRDLGAREGLWIRPCTSIHTLGMAFAIDVVALDRKLMVVDLRRAVKPGRLAFLGRETESVLELPAGRIAEVALRIGDRLGFIAIFRS